MRTTLLRTKNLFRHITLFNTLLLFCIIVTGLFVVHPLYSRGFTLSSLIPETGQGKAPTGIADEMEFPSPAEYMIVGENNLFHPDRIIPAEKKEETPLPKPEIVLYGTMIMGEVKVAYLEDLKEPRSSPGRGRRQMKLQQGDSLSGFVLKEITPDRIIMVRGEEKLSVSIYDSHKKPKTIASSSPPKASGAPSPAPQEPPRPKSIKGIDQDAFRFLEKRRAEAAAARGN